MQPCILACFLQKWRQSNPDFHTYIYLCTGMLVHIRMSQAKRIYFVAVKANRSLNYASRKCWPFISYIIPNTYYISCNLLPLYHYIIIYLIHYMWISYSKLYQCIHCAIRCDQDSQWNHIDNKKNLVQRVLDPAAISKFIPMLRLSTALSKQDFVIILLF